jgi:hypothetical protein
MRKWLTFLLLWLVLVAAGIYFFIPDIIMLRSNAGFAVTRPGLHRMLLQKSSVAKWWPGEIVNDDFYLDGFQYSFNSSNITVMPVSIDGKGTKLISSLFFIELRPDSVSAEWNGSIVTSYNPVSRVVAYQQAKKINKSMDLILHKMQSFYSDAKNIYGFDIKHEFVKDSLLIQTSSYCKVYPSIPFIYSLIDKLKQYALSNATAVAGYPMLNIRLIDSLNFEVKVALPLAKALPNSGDILQKRMLGRGNILVTEVRGGIDITEKAFMQIQQYADDYQRRAPAIPFYSLITDRLAEPDSSKWITKVYFPVM